MSRLVAVLDENRLEGIIVKRKDSTYREGKEPGTWIKHLLYRVGEFIFRGYLKRDDPYFDALIVGEKSGSELHYKQKVRFGFDDEKKRSLMKRMDRLAGIRVPFRESSGETAQRLAERTADATLFGSNPYWTALLSTPRRPRVAISVGTGDSVNCSNSHVSSYRRDIPEPCFVCENR